MQLSKPGTRPPCSSDTSAWIVWISGSGQMESPDLAQQAIGDKSELLPTYPKDVDEH